LSSKRKGSSSGGKCGIVVTGPRACRNIVVDGLRMETWDARYGIMVAGGAVVLGLAVRDALVAGQAACLGVQGVVRGAVIQGNQWIGKGNGIRVLDGGDMRQCMIDLRNKELTDQCEEALLHVATKTMFRGNRIWLPLGRTAPLSQGLGEQVSAGNTVELVTW